MEEIREDKYIEVGKRIAELRKIAEMTQQQLAEAVGYETSTAISLIESGKRRIQLIELSDLAKHLHVTVNYLLTGEKDNTDISVALRSDADLSKEDINSVKSYISWIKAQRGK